jgi:anaerobic magnesium-protoporphyrin IX monomethyl ester cyclase
MISNSQTKPYHVLFISIYNASATGVRYLSSILKSQGYATSILLFKSFHGEYTQNPSLEEYDLLISKVADLQPDLIGLSCLSSLSDSAFREISRRIRLNFPHLPLIAGGPCFTTSPTPERFLDYCDNLLLGYCDDIILDLVRRYEFGTSVKDIPNLCYKEGNEFKRNAIKPLNPNMDSDYLPDIGGQGKCLISNNAISDRDPEMDQTEYSLSGKTWTPNICENLRYL